MVLESLVVYLLDKYLGDFIDNLDTKKLKIDVWSGESNAVDQRNVQSETIL